MKLYDFDPRNLPQELLAALGMLAASSAHTESIVQQAISGFLGLPWNKGLVVTAHLTMPQRFHMLEAAAKEINLDETNVNELKLHISRLKLAFDQRNQALHRSWCRDQATGCVHVVTETARGKLKVHVEAGDAQTVLDTANEMYDAGMELYKFLGLLGLTPKLL